LKGAIVSDVSPDGRFVLVQKGGLGLAVWDMVGGTSMRTLQVVETTRAVRKARFSPDSKRIFAFFGETGDGGATVVWDAATGEARLIFRQGEEWKYPLAFAPRSTLTVSEHKDLAGNEGPQLVLWDWADGHQVRRFDARGGFAAAVAFTADGKSVISADNDGVLRRWGVESGKEQAHFPLGNAPPDQYALTDDGRVAFTAAGKVVEGRSSL